MRFSLGIREQLGAGIVLTTLAGIGLIGLLAIKIVENNAVHSKVREAGATVRFLNVITSRGASAADPAAVAGLAASTLRDTGVTSFRITGERGRVLAKEGAALLDVEGRESKKFPAEGGLDVRLIAGGPGARGGVRGFFAGPGEALYVTAPLRSGGRRAGTVEFLVTMADIKGEMAGVRRFLIYYALIDSVIIIGFGGYYLSRSMVRPVRRLEEAATRISGGALGERAAVDVDNEIGSLARSFNTMAERLEGQIKTLERVNIELLETQEELLRSKTLAAVGGLAAGIAHEIGNPLGAVYGYMELMRAGIDDRDEEAEIIDRAYGEITRIDGMVKEFLDIARPPVRPAEPVDVNRVIEETVAGLAVREDFSDVAVKTDLDGDSPPVEMEEGKLRQVLSNLLVNAAHATESIGGERVIDVATRLERGASPAPAAPRRRKDDPPGPMPGEKRVRDFVVITVTDRGCGMSAADGEKIFEPFYTTKEVGRGTGLGLFVCSTILRAYGGEISFSTKRGEGSTFTVKVPARRV